MLTKLHNFVKPLGSFRLLGQTHKHTNTQTNTNIKFFSSATVFEVGNFLAKMLIYFKFKIIIILLLHLFFKELFQSPMKILFLEGFINFVYSRSPIQILGLASILPCIECCSHLVHLKLLDRFLNNILSSGRLN